MAGANGSNSPKAKKRQKQDAVQAKKRLEDKRKRPTGYAPTGYSKA